ncbi:cytochrome b/b6 domain-containing protein [Pannus brasiliensis CCIBt3594]|uniref:Cytochrome b/b6 domain-containing protein n=1 Tax=Pannus brasiliensis CCIBt3594 TaxID=1427578 RepID=A0AAW9QLY8_9CHRO
MKESRPYQPFLLRVLHGLTGICSIAALLTAYWTYDTYDSRWFTLSLPKFPEIEGIHGTFGLYTLIVFPFFAIYAFRRGSRRLIQSDSLQKLARPGKPIFWYSLHRFANTIALFALAFAIYSGRMMDSEWLPKGELHHPWYYAHLISWVILTLCILFHLLLSAKVGGKPLLLSMLHRYSRDRDRPRLWPGKIAEWWSKFRAESAIVWLRSLDLYKILEMLILTAILAAWIVPLFK